MGITRGSARLLLEEKKRRPFGGSLLELGKMFIFFSDDELGKWARLHGVELPELEPRLSHDPVLAAHGCLSDVSFFRRLGFDDVTSLDASPWEGADLIHDLNEPVPTSLHGRYETVFEGGTMQSIFHLPQVLCNVFHLLKPGGRVIHAAAPSHNHVDHGFFMFSPTFFHDYYSANGWQLDRLLLCEHLLYWTGGRLRTGAFHVYDYEPGCLDHLSFGRFGASQLSLFVVATKTEQTTCHVIPQQSYYRQLWEKDADLLMQEQRQRAESVAPRRQLYASSAYRAYKLSREWLRRHVLARRMPRRIASY